MCKGEKILRYSWPQFRQTLGMIHRASTFECKIVISFQYITSKIEWIGVPSKGFIGKGAKEELGYILKIDSRFMELGPVSADHPPHGKRNQLLEKLIQKNILHCEVHLKSHWILRFAIGLYNEVANATKDKSYATYQHVLKLSEAEVEDEQTSGDILAKLKIKDSGLTLTVLTQASSDNQRSKLNGGK